MIPLPIAFLFLCVAQRMEGQRIPEVDVAAEFAPRRGPEPTLNNRPEIRYYLHEDQSSRAYPPLDLRQAPPPSARVDQSRFAGDELPPPSRPHGNTFPRLSAPRVFCYAPELRSGFQDVPFPISNGSGIKTRVTHWLQELIRQGTIRSHLRHDIHAVKDYIVIQTAESLVDIRELIHGDMLKYDRDIQINSQEIADILRYALTKPSVNRLTPLADLANRLADFNKLDLDASRSAIRSYSDPRVHSLADLHGLLGPQNVFKRPLTALLWHTTFPGGGPDTFDRRIFVEELQQLQMHLAELAEYLRGPDGIRAGSPPPLRSIDAICNFGEKQDGLFGGRAAFQGFLLETTQSEAYKALQIELESPNDIASYELQFVQLPGDAQTLKSVLQPAHGGVVFTASDVLLNSLKKLQQLALENTVKRLDIATQAWQLKQQMLSYYTPTGFSSLSRLDWEMPTVDFSNA
ncbi:hypothetical protein PTTG_28442 [Puccinia triticina 1-1 BBBD Race 1]|uniref:Uncharacterized protein n=1 Tax=Puccinia triticina (isolate 1-1 / race 1 (BBBD)) TaxID=630390 RepID=A0A180GBQ6_PUCT1|nr:hypothetical protein PTTG_28442 [Puccinia triticina 1-1 BBBD Race 1]WAR57222.1 hypothetical protein PtB15_8B269 [Puccinia triticina]